MISNCLSTFFQTSTHNILHPAILWWVLQFGWIKNFPRTKQLNGLAASKTVGISSFTISIAARQCWIRSHSVRTSITSSMYDDIVIVKEDVPSELKPVKI